MLEVLEEEDDFVANELISFFICLRSWFRNTSFNVNNWWLGLPQLTNSSTIRYTFDLFLTPGFLTPNLLLPLILIEEVRDDKSDNLLSLDTTTELMFAWVVLWKLPWGKHIIILIGAFLLIHEIISLQTFTFKALWNEKEDTNTVTLTNISSSHTTTSPSESLDELHDL